MLNKLFGWGKKKEEDPATLPSVIFGRYSDNNKPLYKVNRWTEADNLFKEKKHYESMDAFFDYLKDDEAANVVYERTGESGKFHFYQGSKMVRGVFVDNHLRAEVTLANMPQASVPVMRRLLEMNFNLFYSRFALDGERLCMRFDSDVAAANPNKLYYGLKELATKGDKQDDLLVKDFETLQTTDTEHVTELPAAEKEIKFEYFQKWIKETLDLINTLDADKFSGGIAYLLLVLIYRIDYLIVPEGKLLHELEEIANIYFKKDERATGEKNRDMLEAFKKMQTKTKEEIFPHLFRSKHTFAIVAPQVHKTIADAIYAANQNIIWYRDNNYPQIAAQITEYGLLFCQFSYSMPRPITDLIHLFMRVNHSDYFTALGYPSLYNKTANQFEKEKIKDQVYKILEKWKVKYPMMTVKIENINYENLVNFNHSFSTEIELLNTEPK
jgi:hypothetical protein